MARTRASKPTAKESSESPTPTSTKKIQLPASDANPSKLFILPTKASKDARIVTLPNPRTGQPSRYVACPNTGMYEFKRIAAQKSTPRSWLVEAPVKDQEGGHHSRGGQTVANADLFVATTIDPIFLLLPALAQTTNRTRSGDHESRFLMSDDHFDNLPGENSHLSELLRWDGGLRPLLESRMAAICDTVEAADESMFRLSDEKLATVLLNKARCLAAAGLPPSLEDKFVTKALESPLLTKTTVAIVEKREPPQAGNESSVSTPNTESNESQSTATTAETADTVTSAKSQPSTTATSFTEETADVVNAMVAPPDIINLQRLRTALKLILSSYVPSELESQVMAAIANLDIDSVDFKPLEEYLATLAKLRADAVASRSMGDYSRKRNRDEEEDEARLEKKRKAEEEKKKKAAESRSIRELKKVDTTGMKKMSDFFKKKT
ncbi:hypothetical protein N3K66_005014 [Trichothecium roseum]|uniref:Uncharacterized protein n=1 Tax=Trichothecium roseum TaxID=47278 RepID=A0ACC0V378_9HYPO|nr:hypothetical protein N3K66_005014 [Trichothecium roseum]